MDRRSVSRDGGGFIASESVDGRTLLYISKSVDSPLMAQPLAGGPPRQVIDCVAGTAFAVNPLGIYYLPCSGSSAGDPNPPVHVRNPVTGEDRTLGRLEKFEHDSLPSGFAVSPDGQSVLYRPARQGRIGPHADRGVPVTGMVRRRGAEAGWRCAAHAVGRSAVPDCHPPLTSSAQVSGTTATLRGAVDDASGGVLQGATITLVNTATLATRTAVSDERGAFAFSSLFPGSYDLRCELSGFTTTEHRGIVLSPNDSRGVAIRLEIAGRSEVVAVRAAPAEALRTETGAREGVLTAHQIDNLSIIGRSSLELLRILPGVVAPDQNQLESVSFFGGSNNTWGYTVNGIRSSNNAVSLDGSNLVEASCNCGLMTGVNNDMVQEVKVQSSNFGAEFGSGAVSVSAVTKSGSSRLSGSLYDYARDWHVAANDRSNSITGVEKPKSRFNYPGGNIGGPIPLPFSGYNAKKDRLFFWFGLEVQRQDVDSGSRLSTTISDAARTGDLSEFLANRGQNLQSPRRRADPGLVSRRGHAGARQRSRSLRDAARPRDGKPVPAPELHGCRQSLQLRLQRPRADQPDGGEGAIRLERQRRHEGVRPDLARSRRHRRASRPVGEQRVRPGTADSRPRHQSRALVRRHHRPGAEPDDDQRDPGHVHAADAGRVV